MEKNDLAVEAIQTNTILLPGGNKQLEHLLDQNISAGTNALIVGSGAEFAANQFGKYFSSISIIADDYDSVMHIKMKMKDENKVLVKLMDYAHTDFKNEHFDFIYAQGSISVPGKKDITKELKRVLRSQGLLCAGEIVSLKDPVPGFVADIWERSGLDPIPSSEIKKYYKAKGFEVLSEKNLSDTLKDFYEKIRIIAAKVSKDEKEGDKKYFSWMKHESQAYLKLGGDKYIGFKSLILRKLN